MIETTEMKEMGTEEIEEGVEIIGVTEDTMVVIEEINGVMIRIEMEEEVTEVEEIVASSVTEGLIDGINC